MNGALLGFVLAAVSGAGVGRGCRARDRRGDRGGAMSASLIVAVCPECNARTTVEPREIARIVSRHNNLHHGGESVMEVGHE